MAVTLSVRDLCVRFETDVLRGISLTARTGDLIALMGRSGGGKSTLLRAVAGQVKASSNELLIAGDQHRNVAFLYQNPYAFPWHSVLRNVQEATGLTEGAALERLANVGLELSAQRYPFELSGGMLRRLGLTMALWGPQQLVLLDEPFAGLDDWTRLLGFAAVECAAKSQGKTILMTTHSAEEAVAVADRAIGLGGTPASICLDLPIDLPRPRFGGEVSAGALGEAVADLRRRFAQAVEAG